MGITFNASEVFQMAVRIEENGAAFYRRAAELNKDSDSLGFLEGLAAMEDEHKQIFQEMSTAVSDREKEETAYDPYNEAMLYLETMSDAHGGEGSPNAAAALTGDESIEDILRTGMELEKKSILFYLGVADMVPEKLGKDKVASIIAEEKKHLATLARALKDLNQEG